MSDSYPDLNGNGIPDAFENRLPISEILAAESVTQDLDTLIIEIEKIPRAPKKGEMYISGAQERIETADLDYENFKPWIVRRIIAGIQ